jgi:hypothetical protein
MLSSMADQDVKVRENRLRRMAERQGVRLQKSRRRDRWALDYGHWAIVDSRHGRTVLYGVTIDDVEAWLTREPSRDRKAG